MQHSGFNNTGIICWFNSLLQALISDQYFINILKNINDKNNPSNTLKELNNLIDKIDNNENIKDSSLQILRAIIVDLKNRKRNFDIGNSQQSSSEGLVLLLDMINNNQIDKLFNHHYEVVLKCDNNNEIISKERLTNNIFYLFDEKQLLERGLRNYIISHNDVLEENMIPESYKKKHVSKNKYSRTYKLKYIPYIVIFALNRYFTDGKRYIQRNDSIKLPDTFTLPSFNKKEILYKKISEIDHVGSLNGGHYVSRCLRNDKIYLFNDINVSLSKLETLPSTYLTFYTRVD